ncbi:DUF1501 domain-containing protein [Fimbriiglobus ruber]|uniref:DUF1501 domain-containing protein n=1 Tax=Fimbriiglobus ruber TaxID=1908690 RepID=A0A225DSQ1_9BACT|nr:DUF1501 domain-containing protein [Fimbriiglobus ruber]OWK40229.1 hypothetical protein FRUB_05148 [Fimbriiglobus ruber]
MTFDPTIAATLTRRRLLQFGAGGYLGLNLGGLWRAQAARATGAAEPIKACILVFLYGGPSHIDTFDPKPDAPAEVRGEFKSVPTSAPGVRICEHLPQLARLMHKAAIVRSMHHAAHLHDSGSIHMLTGRPLDGPDRELFAPQPQHFPSYGSAVAAFRPGSPCDVPFASLPFVFHNVVPTPCQGSGILGAPFDPLLIDVDPAKREYRVDVLSPKDGLDHLRLEARRELLLKLRDGRPAGSLDPFYEKAVRLLDSETVRKALDINREPPKVRDRYGYGAGDVGYGHMMRGQNYLLARRLVEAGVPFVNIYDYQQQGQNWDAHAKCTEQHKNHLLPPLDRGLSALIEDLDERGLLDSTLIVVTGEFGRTPKINNTGGRDHWPECSSILLVGGGVTGGAVYGASDRLGAFPAANPVTPGDLAATIFSRFGIDPATEIRDQAKRPYSLATGEPLVRLFSRGA